MAKYKIELKKSAVKEIKNLPNDIIKRVIIKLDELAINPRGKGSLKLTNEDKFRVRVGNYRILYQIFDDKLVVIIVKVAHRKSSYTQ
jgi:mRNA interferase RelE/StbE